MSDPNAPNPNNPNPTPPPHGPPRYGQPPYGQQPPYGPPQSRGQGPLPPVQYGAAPPARAAGGSRSIAFGCFFALSLALNVVALLIVGVACISLVSYFSNPDG